MFWRIQTDFGSGGVISWPWYGKKKRSISPFVHDIALFYNLFEHFYFPLICLVLILDTSFHSISHHSLFILSIFAFCVVIPSLTLVNAFFFSISVCDFNVFLLRVPFTAFYLQTAFLNIDLFYSFFFPLSLYTSFLFGATFDIPFLSMFFI